MTPADGLEHVACALCGADRPQSFLEKDGFTIVRCASCDLVYVDPRPARTELRSLYEQPSYFSGDEWYLDYLAYEKDHRALFERIASILDERCPDKGRLLDVGCAAGFLLDTARGHGWKVTGVDLSPSMARHAKDKLALDVRVGSLEEAAFPPDAFDAVTLCDSIEHMANPLETMKEVRRVLRPGGVALVVTPNIESVLAKLLGAKWPHLTPREHIYYFTPRTLRRLVVAAGFEPLRTTTIGHYFTFEYIGRKLLPWLEPLYRLPILSRSINLNVGDILMVLRAGSAQRSG